MLAMTIDSTAPIPPRKRYSKGDRHSELIRKSLQAQRLAGRHVRSCIDKLVALMAAESTPASVQHQCAMALLERAVGKPSSSVDDQAAVAGAVIQVLSGIARLPTDPPRNLVDVTSAQDAEFIALSDMRSTDSSSVAAPASSSEEGAYRDLFGEDPPARGDV